MESKVPSFTKKRWLETSTPEYAKGKVLVDGVITTSRIDPAWMPSVWAELDATSGEIIPWFVWKCEPELVRVRCWAPCDKKMPYSLLGLYPDPETDGEILRASRFTPRLRDGSPSPLDALPIYLDETWYERFTPNKRRSTAMADFDRSASELRIFNPNSLSNHRTLITAHDEMMDCFETWAITHLANENASRFRLRLWADCVPDPDVSDLAFRVRLNGVNPMLAGSSNLVPIYFPGSYVDARDNKTQVSLCESGLTQCFGFVPQQIIVDCLEAY